MRIEEGKTGIIKKFIFSGHESFQCRQLWLKKGFDFVLKGHNFNSEDAVVHLGVGKNMVRSINHWMKAFGLIGHDDSLTQLAHQIFNDSSGWDPFLEDDATLWLLHYQLVKNRYASTYSIVFNELRKEKIEFTKKDFVNYVKRVLDKESVGRISDNTLNDDINVFVKMYLNSETKVKDKEESFSGIFSDLQIVKKVIIGSEEFLVIENLERPDFPDTVLLYTILQSFAGQRSININRLLTEENSIGSVFAMSSAGIVSKVERLCSSFRGLVFTDHAGIKELQIKKELNTTDLMSKYYGR